MKHFEFGKNLSFALIILFLCAILVNAADSQTKTAAPVAQPPTVLVDQKLELREAQHRLDLVEKRISDLNVQLMQLQQQAQHNFDAFTKEKAAAQAAVDAAIAKIANGIDPKKWTLDQEAADFKAAEPATEAKKTEPPKKP